MMTLADYNEKCKPQWRYVPHESGCVTFPFILHADFDRVSLFHLKDYFVSGIIGGRIWMQKRSVPLV
jgi:hypothetical protein